MLTIGDGEHSGEEEGESVPVCSVGRDISTDDVCADAAVAPLQAAVRRDGSPTEVVAVLFIYKCEIKRFHLTVLRMATRLYF